MKLFRKCIMILHSRLLKAIVRLLKLKGTLDTERALRAKNAEIIRLRHELEQVQRYSPVYQLPLVRQASGEIAVQIDLIGQRQMYHQFDDNATRSNQRPEPVPVTTPPASHPQPDKVVNAPPTEYAKRWLHTYTQTNHEMPAVNPLENIEIPGWLNDLKKYEEEEKTAPRLPAVKRKAG